MANRKRYIDEVRGKGPFFSQDGVERNPVIFLSFDMVPPDFYLDESPHLKPKTPNLESLAKDGIFFSHAFSTSPLCSPSRASYLTGRYSYITTNSERAHDGHEIHLRDDDRMFPEFLKAVGYRTRHYGKSHVGTHKFVDVFSENDSPWDRWSPPWYDDEGYAAYLKDLGFVPPSFDRKIRGKGPSGKGEGNFYGGWLASQEGTPFPMEGTYPVYLARRAVQGLRTLMSGNPHPSPLYLQVDFFEPHQPFAIPAGMEERERQLRQELRLPESYQSLMGNGFEPVAPEPRVYTMYRRYWGLRDPQTLMDYRVAHILQFEVLDHALGILLSELKEQGLYDSSWIFLIADHGEMNGEMGLIDKGSFLNPRVVRAPIWMKPPTEYATEGIPSRGCRVESPVSLLDLAPTILESAGIHTEDRLDGHSLLAAVRGESRPEDKPILFEVWSHVVPNPSMGLVFSWKGDLWVYTCNFADGLDELYRTDDLWPPVNRFHHPDYEEVRERGLMEFYRVLKSDPRWAGYVTAFELKYPDRFEGEGDRQKFQ
ncbi:MAG: hypothetical protein Kow009_06420 [Spirochaetales bacterium]